MMKPFLTYHKGKDDEVQVYRVYSDPEDSQNRMPTTFWFSTDPTDIDADYPGACQFDVRELNEGASFIKRDTDGRGGREVPVADNVLRQIIRKGIIEDKVPI